MPETNDFDDKSKTSESGPARLEIECPGNGTLSSNLSLSAIAEGFATLRGPLFFDFYRIMCYNIKKKTDGIDIGVKGMAPEHFFEFGWESCRDLSRPVDVIDLDYNCLFGKLAEKDGEVIYGQRDR
ncbi:MAG TPA: hypothetical protein DC017_13945 [Candidatus Wallbacteria bacterium]|nr:hypothetical protein [Candidatus Wallbacteria bacterium]